MEAHNNGNHLPEYRIPLTLIGALIAPIGFFIYAWTSQYLVHWIFVDIGMFIAMFGLQLSGMPWTAYIIDAYPDHVSSAMAAAQFLMSLTAFLFPLFAPALFAKVGYGWGNSLLGFMGVALGVPAPWIIWKFGARLREKARSSH